MSGFDLDLAASEAVLRAAKEAALEEASLSLLGRCMATSPVDTGNLRR